MRIPDSTRWKATGRTLGQGGQAAVFVVTDKENEFAGEYAFKAVSPGKPKKAYERFAKEIEATKSLDNPYIVRIFDHSAPDDSLQFYVMEYVKRARPLKKLLNTSDNPFAGNPLKSLKFFRQIASAIDACTKVGIVHRDLSPANVLIQPNDDVKIIDFGCCQINETERVTLTDEGVGTQNYMAPECESGAAGQILSQADLYSAGKLLWSAIVNQFAFSREKPAYGTKSMQVMFPQQLMAWHLHHVFAGTIRHDFGKRFANAEAALAIAGQVEWLVTSGKTPLQRFAERPTCPSCGWGVLVHMADDWTVFHNPLPSGYSGCRCNHCGICFPINWNTLRENVDKMDNLE